MVLAWKARFPERELSVSGSARSGAVFAHRLVTRRGAILYRPAWVQGFRADIYIALGARFLVEFYFKI